MWRALALSIGIFLIILGVECLGVETFQLTMRDDPPPKVSPFDNAPKIAPPKTVKPPVWMPWSLLASGAVTCLYSFTLPRKMKKGEEN